jgi:hypothetical protein
MPVQRGMARRLGDSFAATGISIHSGHGATAWISIALCERNQWPHEVVAGASGYLVRRRGEPAVTPATNP